MKIERLFAGMYDGKIQFATTSGVTHLVTDANLAILRRLTPDDSLRYFWLPTEQVIAIPHVTTTDDHDGRPWTQNETLLIPIHQYLHLTNPVRLLQAHFVTHHRIPDPLEPLDV